ncbi:MAG: serine/threonine-protein kinase, partial [Planctomycetota bacterium]
GGGGQEAAGMPDEPANTDEDWVDSLARVDEQLGSDSTAIPEDSVDAGMADCLRLLSRIQHESPHWPGRVDADWLHTDATPHRIGRFRIRRQLGMGGFGIVFLAYDPSLDREVALKVPRLESLISKDARARFLRESKLAASLAHPNIAAIYESGFVEPAAYIASAYCAGGSVLDLIHEDGKTQPLPPRTAAQLIMTIAQAVQHAHSRDVLHRDIKPSNLLLDVSPKQIPELRRSPDALAAVVRLVDFGLARNLTREPSPAEQTLTGTILGTPAYMAPEQISGERDNVTEVADVYALGATLYCLLVGEAPFRGTTDWETLAAVKNRPPVPPSRLRPDVPRDLDAICLKCLEKEPKDRYCSANELELDLHRFLRDEPIEARPPNGPQRLTRWGRRNPALATSVFGLLVVLTTAAAMSTYLWQRSLRATREAQMQSSRVRQAVDQLLTAIAEEPSLRSEGMESFRQRLLQAASDFYDQIRHEQSGNTEVISEHVETLTRLARIHRALGDHQHAKSLWKEAHEIVLLTFPHDTQRRAFLLAEQSQELEALGDLVAATQLSVQAIHLHREALGDGDINQLVRLLTNHAQQLISNKDYAEANRILDEVVGLVDEVTGVPPSDWPTKKLWGIVLRDKARALSGMGHYRESNQVAGWSMGILRRHLERCPADRSACLMHQAALNRTLGYNRVQVGQQDAAEQHYRQAYEISMQLWDQHPDVGMLLDYVVTLGNELARALATTSAAESRALLELNRERIDSGRLRFPDLESQWKQREGELSRLATQ